MRVRVKSNETLVPRAAAVVITKFPEIGLGMIKPYQEHHAHHAHHTQLVTIRSDIVRILGSISIISCPSPAVSAQND